MDKRGKGRGEGDPRETTKCKQAVEEEVRKGEGVLVLCGSSDTKEWERPCLQPHSS